MAAEIKGDRAADTYAEGTKSSSDDDLEHQSTHNRDEKGINGSGSGTENGNLSDELKLDSNGLPLVPQPSRFKDDPLVSRPPCPPPPSRCT